MAILGANGAGKTTTLRAISGVIHRVGQITFLGRSLLGSSASDTARLGIAHVPEGRGTMGQLTVAENLQLGARLGDGDRRRSTVGSGVGVICQQIYYRWFKGQTHDERFAGHGAVATNLLRQAARVAGVP